jgi:hypothetical protein
MLLSFRVANHRSIRDEQQLKLSPVYDVDRPEGTRWEAVPVAALFGANASGKSNVVDALRYMARMVRSSHQDAEPGEGVVRCPFLLDEGGAEEASWYVVDLLLGGVRHTYGFSVDSERVLDEWLYTYPHGRKRTVFQRSADEIHFGEAMPKREMDLVRSITEPNALFVSVAARSRQQVVRPVYDWFQEALRFRTADSSPERNPALWQMLGDERQKAAIVKLLRAADLGIEGVGVEKRSSPESHWHTYVEMPIRSTTADAIIKSLTQTTAERRVSGTRIWVEQRGRNGTTRMGLENQSEGTRALLTYAAPVLQALADGGMLVVDEIDSSLHPRLTTQVIRLFQDRGTNPHGAQLLLTTHDSSLLGRSGGEDILKRDQVWFVEKDEYGETTLFPLSDFKPRQEENRERRYLGGSYGAVPFLSDERFEAAIAARSCGAGDGEDSET